MTKWRIGILSSVSLLVTTGCFHYAPSRLSDMGVGEDVQVRVTSEQADRLSKEYGTVGERIRGRLVDRPDGSLFLETFVPRSRTRIYQRVGIPVGEVVEVEARELHRLRTGFLVSGLTAVTAAVVAKVFTLGRNVQDERPDEINRMVIPIFRLRW